MTISHDPRTRTGRYSREKVALEIERHIQTLGRGAHARAAEALGISSQQLSHRIGGRYHLDIREIGILADHWGAPTGWPFVSWDEAEERDAAWKERKRR